MNHITYYIEDSKQGREWTGRNYDIQLQDQDSLNFHDAKFKGKKIDAHHSRCLLNRKFTLVAFYLFSTSVNCFVENSNPLLLQYEIHTKELVGISGHAQPLHVCRNFFDIEIAINSLFLCSYRIVIFPNFWTILSIHTKS